MVNRAFVVFICLLVLPFQASFGVCRGPKAVESDPGRGGSSFAMHFCPNTRAESPRGAPFHDLTRGNNFWPSLSSSSDATPTAALRRSWETHVSTISRSDLVPTGFVFWRAWRRRRGRLYLPGKRPNPAPRRPQPPSPCLRVAVASRSA